MKLFRYLLAHKRLVILAIVVLLVAGYFLTPKNAKGIDTAKATKGDIIESLSTTGYIDSQTTVNLNFLASGKVVYLSARNGDAVVAGQTIAALDQRTIKKNLETALRNYSLQRNTFDKVQSDNQNRSPDQALNNEMERILENNQYDLDKAVISVELQELAKEQAYLISPIAGVITRSDIPTQGMNVGITSIVTVADPLNLVFKMDIDEAEIGKVRQGLPIKVILDAYPDEVIDLTISKIDFITHKTSTGGDAYTVEALFPENTAMDYRIGMNGDVEIKVNEHKNVIKIPISSVTDDGRVYILTDKGYEDRKVVMGLQDDTEVEIKEGLNEGDLVAIDPAEAEKTVKKKGASKSSK